MVTQKFNHHCWMINLDPLKSLILLKMTIFSKMGPKNDPSNHLLNAVNMYSVSWLYLMVYIHLNCYIWPIMLKWVIFSYFPYILYRKWLKITFCLLPTCPPLRESWNLQGNFLYHQDDIQKFWCWLYFFSQGCASDRFEDIINEQYFCRVIVMAQEIPHEIFLLLISTE